MPLPLDEEASSDASSEGGDIFHGAEEPADANAKEQLKGDLHHDVERAATEASNQEDEAGPDEEDGGDDDDEEGEEEYNVEAIKNHMVKKGQVLYEIKWQGYSEAENTYEPEVNLLPHARNLLAAYHEKIGGTPQPNGKKAKSKQPLRTPSTANDSPAPKRRRLNNDDADGVEDDVGTWVPRKEDWDGDIVSVETVEKNEAGQLVAYICFKNGKKTKVGMDKVYRHCPRSMLRFYEAHLKFQQVQPVQEH